MVCANRRRVPDPKPKAPVAIDGALQTPNHTVGQGNRTPRHRTTMNSQAALSH